MNATPGRTATRRSPHPAGAIALLLGSTLFAAAPLPAAGQEAPEAESRCICVDEIHERMGAMLSAAQGARLGVYLGDETTIDGRPGVELEDVPEGTPARRAGLRAGDVIVALEGVPLGDRPARALRDQLAEAEPGDTVEVSFYRQGDRQVARVVTDAAVGVHRLMIRPGRAPRMPAPPGVPPMFPPGAPHAPVLERFELDRDRPEGHPAAMVFRGRSAGLDLVAMNPELGRYFGTDEGVLVAAVPEESSLGLRAGDVILSIGGRAVLDPGHARAILASYREGEEIIFGIVREERRVEVSGRRS